MARKINAKLVLELLGKGMSAREIRRTRHIAPQSVAKVRAAAEAAGVGWEDVATMDEGDVYRLLFPESAKAEEAFIEPDYDYVHTELQRTGVTMQLLHEELRDRAAEEGLLCKSYTTFCRGYADHVAARRVTNHLEHKPGQVMEVDWSGAAMRLADPFTGEVSKAHLFVACLPYSQMTYVEATADMRQNTWLSCHVNAWDFFGGVAVRTVCDNLKTGRREPSSRGRDRAQRGVRGARPSLHDGDHADPGSQTEAEGQRRRRRGQDRHGGRRAPARPGVLDARRAERRRPRAARRLQRAALPEKGGIAQGGVRRGGVGVPLAAARGPVRGQRMVLRALRQPQLPCVLQEEQLLGAVCARRQEGGREGHRLHGGNLPRGLPRRHPPALPPPS